MGGDSYPDPKSQNFSPAAGQENRIFRCFRAKNFPPAAGKSNVFLVFTNVLCKKALLSFVKVSNLRAGAVPVVFTSVGTRVYYSQKYLSAVYARRCVLRG